jgi:hypothetical protein
MDRFAGTTAGESRERAVQAARDAFGPDWKPDGVAIAPGRIELLGNHVDYNGGPVLAAAIDRFIVVAIAREPGREQTVRAIAADAPDEAAATLEADALASWRNPSPPPRSLDYVRAFLLGSASVRPRRCASVWHSRSPKGSPVRRRSFFWLRRRSIERALPAARWTNPPPSREGSLPLTGPPSAWNGSHLVWETLYLPWRTPA